MRPLSGALRRATIAALAAVATVTMASGAAGATPAQGTIRPAGTGEAVRDSYIVALANTATGAVPATASRLAARYGGKAGRTYHSALRGFEVRMPEAAARRLAADPEVRYVARNAVYRVKGTQTNPPSWGLDRVDQRYLPLDSSYSYAGPAGNVHAYIIDTGIRFSHVDFGGRATSGFDAIDGGSADDCYGHGTHVAGTLGGTAYGVAKGVSLVSVRVLDCDGYGTTDTVVAGVDWVTGNAIKPAVANMSLGGGLDPTLDDAVANSIASGITYAVAAGNDGRDACHYSPADVPGAITVGATTSTDAKADYSNYGTCVDLFAPGTDITSDFNSSDEATRTWSGTSMATPHVAGAAALVLAANPGYTPQQVRDALVNGATVGMVINPGTASPNRLLYQGSVPQAVNDFSVGVTPAASTVAAGGGVTPMVTTALARGAAQPVTLAAGGLPAGATATLNPPSVTVGAASTLTIATTGATQAGTYPITITATGTSVTHVTTFTLTVYGAGTCLAGQILGNADFEQGPASWSGDTDVIGIWDVDGGEPPVSGYYNAWMSGGTTAVTLSQSVFMSAGCASYTLGFYLHVRTEDTGPTAHDTLTVSANGTVLASYSNLDAEPGYQLHQIDLSRFAGQNVSVQFTGSGDATLPTSFFLDYTSLTLVAPPPPGDFSLAADPASGMINVAGSVSTRLAATLTSGAQQNTTLSAGGLPAGATASFVSTTLTVGSATTMYITTGASTPPGTYPVVVTAAGPSATHSLTYTLTVTDNRTAACVAGQLFGNPDFEDEQTVWAGAAETVDQWGIGLPDERQPPHSGMWNALLGGSGHTSTQALSQPVFLPAGCSSYTLNFWLHIDTYDLSGAAHDLLTVTANGTALASYSNADVSAPDTYTLRSVNLSGYAGQPVSVQFTSAEDASLASYFVLDDVTMDVGPPVGDFSAGVSPAAGTITVAGNLQASVSTAVTSGAGQQVSLSVGGRPPLGVTFWFSPSVVAAGTAATMYIATDPTTPTGSYPITVVATGQFATHTASYTLTVAADTAGTCASGQKFGNAGFEAGPVVWTQKGNLIIAPPLDDPTVAPTKPRGGAWYALLGGDTAQTDVLAQSVYLSRGCSSYTLGYYLQVTTADTGTTAHDTLSVTVNDTQVASYSNLDAAGYTYHTVDLAGYAGKAVTVRFIASTDAALSTTFILDDTSLTLGAAGTFSLVASPTSGTVNVAGYTSTSLRTALTSGSSQSVSFSVAGLPAGTTATFSQPQVTVGGWSSMYLTAGPSTPPGTYPVTVTATGPLSSQSTGYTLTVSNNRTGGCTTGQRLGNPGFNDGPVIWSQSGNFITSDYDPESNTHYYYAVMGAATAGTGQLSQPVYLPAGCTSYTLGYDLAVNSSDTSGTAHDTFVVTVNGTPVATYSNVDQTTGYVHHTVDLSAYAGQAVQVEFDVTTDATLATWFNLDGATVTLG